MLVECLEFGMVGCQLLGVFTGRGSANVLRRLPLSLRHRGNVKRRLGVESLVGAVFGKRDLPHRHVEKNRHDGVAGLVISEGLDKEGRKSLVC